MPTTPAPFTPRNLIVLSDGTGNSSAKLFKTNVWRVYDALDLSCPDQVALYDDGVGTAGFKPLAILGGAFGYGLKRNVLDLYTFLCRNYRVAPANPATHDRIFAFGFSRGAFTARVVAALVAHEGLIQGAEGPELKRLATRAYRRYREHRYRNSLGVWLLRKLRDGLVRVSDTLRGKVPYDPSLNRKVDIDFLGVWDTVAAYGLPIDELTRGWDRWIWPMMPRSRELPPEVKRARHAVALDDERQTFFPLLWDERGEPANASSTGLGDERLSQVWFAGVHSNVGGGYPDDSLAYTSLCWMAGEAAAYGLRFLPSRCPGQSPIPVEWKERAVACAPMNDSRRGLGAYYRYHPRPVARLCQDLDNGVVVSRVKVHESVLERLRDTLDGYATLTLPPAFAVVTRGGVIQSGDGPAAPGGSPPNPFEHSSQGLARQHQQQAVFNAVWWRRVVYFLTVGVTLAVALLPLCPVRDRIQFLAGAYPVLAPLVDLVGSMLPGFASDWLDHYRENPAQLFAGGAVIGLLLTAGVALQRQIGARMRAVWQRHGLEARPVAPVPEPTDVIYRLRTSRAYRGFFRFLSLRFWPTVFGLALLVLLVLILPVRAAFELTTRTPGFCLPPGGARPLAMGQHVDLLMWPSEMCHATGVQVEARASYRIEIALPPPCGAEEAQAPEERRVGQWADASIPVESPRGFSTMDGLARGWRGVAFVVGYPFRRVLGTEWFVPIATIGTSLPERHQLAEKPATFTAARKGPLALFVNDAMLPSAGWTLLYRNNAGGPAFVRITRVVAPDAPTGRPAPSPVPCDAQRTLAATR